MSDVKEARDRMIEAGGTARYGLDRWSTASGGWKEERVEALETDLDAFLSHPDDLLFLLAERHQERYYKDARFYLAVNQARAQAEWYANYLTKWGEDEGLSEMRG